MYPMVQDEENTATLVSPADLASLARDEKRQPDVYLGYLLGWLVLIGLIVLVIFPMLETTIGILLIAILLAAYVGMKYYFGKQSIFTS